MKRPGHDGFRDESGVAYVEFLIAFLPLFTLFLGLVQWALMGAGDLVVQHAASRAVRAAIVVLDDDPARYDDADRRQVDPDGEADTRNPATDLLGVSCGSVVGALGPSQGGPRLAAIRQAASFPLLAISPSFRQLELTDSIRTALDDPDCRAAAGSTLYNSAAMAVTFPVAPGATEYRTAFSHGDQVTARVTYAFHCGVPLINRLMCESYPTLRDGAVGVVIDSIFRQLAEGSISWEAAQRQIERAELSLERHERDQDAAEELGEAANDRLLYLTSLRGARYKLMRGEATMPLQSARYAYED